MTAISLLLPSTVVLAIGLALMPLLRKRSAALRHWVLIVTLVSAAASPLLGRVAPGLGAQTPLVTLTTDFVTAAFLPTPASPGAKGVGAVPAAPTTADTYATPSASSVLAVVWAAGAAVSLLMLAGGVVRLRELTNRADVLSESLWTNTVNRLSAAYGIERPVGIRVSRAPVLLLVWGARRPTLLIHQEALAWTVERVTAVVQHELAHVRRGDWALQVLTEVICAVYWFHPLMWMARARARAESEIACDDVVLRDGMAPADYATHIVTIARDLKARGWLPAPAIVRRSTLERRITAMLDPSRDRRPLSSIARAVTLASIILTSIVIAGVAAQSFVSMTGTIVDPSQGVLPNVTLVLTSEQTQAKYEIKTDSNGRYEFVGLPPGNYVLDAALPGFSRFKSRVTIGSQNLQQDVVMSIGTIQESVTVRYGATVPPPDPAVAQRIEELKQKRAVAPCSEVQPADAVRIGGNIRVPLKYRDVRPNYPEALRGTDGFVVLTARITTEGSVDDVKVVESTHAPFAEAAIEAVRQWEFGATLLNCERVGTAMQVTVNFKAK